MAKKVDTLTVETPVQETVADEPRVRVYLPLLESEGAGVHIDQYEHVTVNGETTLVRRGEYVDVTVPVFIQLKNKFPHL
jgi:hypothetical protein|nr:MAG TPA: hypothetical protein [Caudoviricetes sp.]